MKHMLLLVVLAIPLPGNAQSPETMEHDAMQKLTWWTGNWTGTSWASNPAGGHDTIVMKEQVRPQLGGTILLVEGTGVQPSARPGMDDTAHHAIAILSFDPRSHKYRWQTWRVPGGMYSEGEPVVGERSFQWSFDTGRGKLRYSITLDQEGRWQERGEFSADGTAWRQVFGMTLVKS